jgi:geranylgeranyl diphosphate synthase, type I
MASANSLFQSSPSESTGNVAALIEHSFVGDGGTYSVNQIQTAFYHHFKVLGSGSRIELTRDCGTKLGIRCDDACCLAASVECLHNASLVQDDLQDGSVLRRGQPSVAAHFGNDVALGLADQLITTAFVCLSGASCTDPLPFLISRINRAVGETVEGQTREHSGSLNGSSLDTYLEAAKKKSGPLFALSLELPLIYAGHMNYLKTAHEAACQFGLGYQILDDLKDQKSDLRNEWSANIVFALEASEKIENASTVAAGMAERLLHQAASEAKSLPSSSGLPLIGLIDRLIPQIDAFKS